MNATYYTQNPSEKPKHEVQNIPRPEKGRQLHALFAQTRASLFKMKQVKEECIQEYIRRRPKFMAGLEDGSDEDPKQFGLRLV